MLKKIKILGIAALSAISLAAFMPATPASAHRTWSADRTAAINFAFYTDCGRALDWRCARQLGYVVDPLSAVPFTDHQTTTTVSYIEQKIVPFFNFRNCWTTMRMRHGEVIWHSKTCG